MHIDEQFFHAETVKHNSVEFTGDNVVSFSFKLIGCQLPTLWECMQVWKNIDPNG